VLLVEEEIEESEGERKNGASKRFGGRKSHELDEKGKGATQNEHGARDRKRIPFHAGKHR
jgi:hypothetical protein